MNPEENKQKKEQILEENTNKQGTMIKRIVLDGFKSFAKYTELLMGNSFNIILGPNGSGKSNVLDALCFVLGKSSSKSLRAEKSSNLIYNGGKTKKASKQAEVSIWLDNTKKIFPLQDQDIKISRIVNQTGTSKYKINSKLCTRGEIIELLSSVKVNPDGYNIILQGDITRFIGMSSIERRQVIEEIAGIGIYEEKKNQALNELAKVEEKLNEAEIILKERQKYIKDLKKDRDQALKSKTINDKIKQNKASICKTQLENKKKNLLELNIKINKNKEKLNTIKEESRKIKQKLEGKRQEINQINKEIEEKSEKEQSNIQKEIENLRIEIATKKTKITESENQKQKILERINQLNSNSSQIEKKAENTKEKKAELKAQEISLTKTIEELSNKINQFRKKHNIDDITEFEKEIEQTEKEIDLKQKETEEIRNEQQNILREKDKNEFQLQITEDKIKKTNEIRKTHKEEMTILEQKRKEFKKITEELNTFLDEDSKSAVKTGELRKELNEKEEKFAKEKIKQNAIKEIHQANIAVKKIIENKEKIGGIHGTIAELCGTEEKFGLALEVAAGKKMQSIITETDKIAAEAINFLKEKKLGVATFLPLNKIKPHKDKIQQKKEGIFGLAIDLITFDPLLKNAFSHVFGNTLIVKNIETARKTGIGTIRMATLEGDLIEKSGAITGGFRQKKTGIFKNKNSEEETKKLEEEINHIQKEIEKIYEKRRKNEEQIMKFREFKANIEGEIIKTEKSLQIESTDIGINEEYKKELMENIEKTNKKAEEIEQKITKKINELTEFKIKKQNIKNKINSLRSPTILAELNAFEEKKKELTTQKIKTEAELENTEMHLKEIINREKENTEKLIKESKKETEEIEKTKKELEQEITKEEKELKKKEEEQARFTTQFKSLFEKRNKINEETKIFENKISKTEEEERKEEIFINTLDIERRQIENETNILEKEFENFEGIELINKKEEELKKELITFEKELSSIGNVNMRALEIYATAEKEYNILTEKKEKLFTEKKSVMELMEEIETNKKEIFLKTLTAIDENFKNVFSKLTTHGGAFLELENKENPFEAGLLIKVRISGEKFLDLRSLSGGEKTLTALAFLFSIQEHEPAPFYILDEIDAALDKENCDKLAKLIREYCKNAQYIVISHKENIISEGDILYGISKHPETEISTAVSIKMS
jgi:chromosome segregation protein